MDHFLKLAETGLVLMALATAPAFVLAHLRLARANERLAAALERSRPPLA